jgi:hypothetical protein
MTIDELAYRLARALGEFYVNPEWSGEPMVVNDIDNDEEFRSVQGRWEEQEYERQSQTEAMKYALQEVFDRTYTDWGFIRDNYFDEGTHVETQWTGHDGWTTGPYNEDNIKYYANGRQVVKRERIPMYDIVGEWEEV